MNSTAWKKPSLDDPIQFIKGIGPKKAQELVDEDTIKMYTMTKMTSSPDLDFARFGYTKSEEVWVAGI